MENKKIYVDVNVDHLKNGICRPRMIRWQDGRMFEVDKIKKICRAASTKAGGIGIRYTVVVTGVETFLFDEGNGKWFVEARN